MKKNHRRCVDCKAIFHINDGFFHDVGNKELFICDECDAKRDQQKAVTDDLIFDGWDTYFIDLNPGGNDDC